MLAPVEARSVNVPLGPLVERWTSNPVSLVELSCHDTSIRLSDAATALAIDGGFTVGPPAPVAPASKAGATGCLRSQLSSRKSSPSEPAREYWGRASIVLSPKEGLVYGSRTPASSGIGAPD